MENIWTLLVVFVAILGLFRMESTNNNDKCDSINGTMCCSGYMWDPITGQCISCKKGYTGKNCQIACPFPSYGLNCQLQCNCNREDCNYVIGCTKHTGGVFDVSLDISSLYNKSIYNTTDITSKRPSVNNHSYLFSLIVIIAVLFVIFAFFLYTQLFQKRHVAPGLV